MWFVVSLTEWLSLVLTQSSGVRCRSKQQPYESKSHVSVFYSKPCKSSWSRTSETDFQADAWSLPSAAFTIRPYCCNRKTKFLRKRRQTGLILRRFWSEKSSEIWCRPSGTEPMLVSAESSPCPHRSRSEAVKTTLGEREQRQHVWQHGAIYTASVYLHHSTACAVQSY